MSASHPSFTWFCKRPGQKNNYGSRRNHSIMFYDLTLRTNQLLRMRVQCGGYYISQRARSPRTCQASVQVCKCAGLSSNLQCKWKQSCWSVLLWLVSGTQVIVQACLSAALELPLGDAKTCWSCTTIHHIKLHLVETLQGNRFSVS